jgi:hypothetical protein
MAGYICGKEDCTPPAGLSSVMTSCPANYYLCPASFNYGCCRTGYGCATNACYITDPSTTTYTRTVTTTTAGGQTITTTQTATTIQTPTAPTAVPATSDPNAVAKFIPTSVAKVPAISTSSSDGGGGGGLTTPQLGGIIGGALGLLIIVVIAVTVVIRRLNRVAKVVETAKASSSDQSKSTHPGHPNMAQYGRPSPSEIDGMAYDPLMMATPGDSIAGTPRTLGLHGRTRSDSDYSQPSVTPYGHASGTPSEAPQHPNLDSAQPGGYFDIPPRVHNMPGRHSVRTSVDSQGNVQQYGTRPAPHQQHGRQWSNASEQSNASSDAQHGLGSPLIPAELDIAGGFIPELPSAESISPPDGSRQRSGSGAVGSPRPSLNNVRQHSSSSMVAGGLPSPAAMTGHQPLEPVNESAEVMHGYYGPRHRQTGQTAAGLDIDHDITSPVTIRFQGRE